MDSSTSRPRLGPSGGENTVHVWEDDTYIHQPRQRVHHLSGSDMCICVDILAVGLAPDGLLKSPAVDFLPSYGCVGCRVAIPSLHPDSVMWHWSGRLRISVGVWRAFGYSWRPNSRYMGQCHLRHLLWYRHGGRGHCESAMSTQQVAKHVLSCIHGHLQQGMSHF